MSVYDLFERFPDEKSARLYLEQKRWNGNITCPRCGSTKIGKFGKNEGWHRCNGCGKPFNVRTDSVFESSKIPLNKWFLAFYLMVTARKGISSMQISKILRITQKSAWFMCQKARKAMGNCKNNYIFKGIVECDETHIGGKKCNRHSGKNVVKGRGPVGKISVFGIVERQGRAMSMVVLDRSKNTLQGIIRQNVERGTVINTDEWKSYIGLNGDYTHNVVSHSKKQYVKGASYTNTIESMWAVLKRAYRGTFHYISPKYLQRYLDEFDFRHNEGNVRYPTMDRISSLV
ncbi:MAG: IS1595 family transposase, partial [Candidatus Fibromonas sp.]|nr:IS1595 family transposase [Candidatus Fibromonas sp.]